MGILYLVGLGPQPEMVTLKALEILGSCDAIFYEEYTSSPSQGSIGEIEVLVGRSFTRLAREDLEDLSGNRIFEELEKGKRVCLAAWGDPMTATTHIALATEALKRGHGFRYVPGVSAVTMVLGLAGLMIYRLGRVMTMVRPRSSEELEGIVSKISETLGRGLGVVLLLEMDGDKGIYMGFPEACRILASKAREMGEEAILRARAFGIAGGGSRRERICYGSLEELSEAIADAYPQSLVLVPQLYFTEREFIESLPAKGERCWDSGREDQG